MRRNPWNFKRDLKCVTYNLIFNNQSICQDFPGDAYNHTRAHPHTPAEDIWRKNKSYACGKIGHKRKN